MPLLSYKCGFWLLVAVITLLMVKEVLLPEYDTRGSKAVYNSYQMGIVLNRTEVIAEGSRSDSIPRSSGIQLSSEAMMTLSHLRSGHVASVPPKSVSHNLSTAQRPSSRIYNRNDTATTLPYHGIETYTMSHGTNLSTILTQPNVSPNLNQKTSYLKSFLKNSVPEIFPRAVFNETYLALQGNKKEYLQHIKAQDEEDAWLYENFLYGMTNGTILESGAFDGFSFSTSHMYEYVFGWKPIHIEADPENFKYLTQHRPNSTNLNIALCNGNKSLHYSSIPDWCDPCRGFIEFMTPDFLSQYHNKLFINKDTIQKIPWHLYTDPWNDPEFLNKFITMDVFKSLLVVQCVPLKSVLEELNVKHIDLWVLDTEGAEESILHSTDFNVVTFNIIAMECRADSAREIAVNERKTKFLNERNFTCQQVLRNCMCKSNTYLKHEIGPRSEDRSTLYVEHRKRDPYLIPATI